MTIVDFGQVEADAVALPVAHPFENLDSRLASLAESGELRGKRGEAVVLHEPRVVAAGVGERSEVDAEAVRTAGAAGAPALSRGRRELALPPREEPPVAPALQGSTRR